MHPAWRKPIAGAVIGTGLGAGAGYGLSKLENTQPGYDWGTGKVRNRTSGEKKLVTGVNMASLGILGGATGFRMGANSMLKDFHAGKFNNYSPAAAKSAVPKEYRHIKTQAQAKKYKHQQARNLHPDLHGGSDEKMKGFNEKWQDFEKHHVAKMPKLAALMFGSFADELEKIYNSR